MFRKPVLTLIVSLSLLILLTNFASAAPSESPGKATKEVPNQKEEKIVPTGNEVKRDTSVQNKSLLDRIKERVTGREQVKEEKELKACEKVQNRLGEKAAQFENNKRGHLVAYGNASDRLEKFIEKYGEMGYDTTKLETNLVKLNELITGFGTEYDTYIAALQTAKDKPCGESQKDYLNSMAEAKTALTDLRAGSIAVREYFNTEIKANLLEIRQQIIDETQDTSEDTEVSGEEE